MTRGTYKQLDECGSSTGSGSGVNVVNTGTDSRGTDTGNGGVVNAPGRYRECVT